MRIEFERIAPTGGKRDRRNKKCSLTYCLLYAFPSAANSCNSRLACIMSSCPRKLVCCCRG
jgi:hypothetical protein